MNRASANKLVDRQAVVNVFKDGDVVMLGGFNKVGAPGTLFKFMQESQAKDLTFICNNCSNDPEGIWYPAASMINDGRVKAIHISFTRTNTDLVELWESGKVALEMVPQGTLAERIRAGAFGLGGVLTSVGYGTILAEGKQVIEVQGEKYLLELPLKADIALVKARKADRMGNARCFGTAKNFNTLMAPAARFTILEAEEIVEVGQLDPDSVEIPSIFVDMVVQSEVSNA